MNKHTPGPWNVHDFDFRVVEADKKVIADLRTYNPSDAALVAAAPDLFDAAETAYIILGDIFNEWKGRNTADGQHALCMLRDAIAKATGRELEDVQNDYCNRIGATNVR